MPCRDRAGITLTGEYHGISVVCVTDLHVNITEELFLAKGTASFVG
jgi:predicted Ser/Thr protein kinase